MRLLYFDLQRRPLPARFSNAASSPQSLWGRRGDTRVVDYGVIALSSEAGQAGALYL